MTSGKKVAEEGETKHNTVIRVYDHRDRNKILSEIVLDAAARKKEGQSPIDIEVDPLDPQNLALGQKYGDSKTCAAEDSDCSGERQVQVQMVPPKRRKKKHRGSIGGDNPLSNKCKNKDIISLPKMKIIVKSTKTISFDGYSDESSNSDSHSLGKKNK